MILQIEAIDEVDAFKKTFIKLFELKEEPIDDELIKESSAVIYINNPATSTRYTISDEGFNTTGYDYSELVSNGNEFSNIEADYWNKELFQNGKVPELISYLKSNKMSKRAILNLWNDNNRDLTQPAPCLTYLNFRVTSKGLRVLAHMRANNAHKCLLIDLDALRALQKYVASKLSLEAGEYIHIVDSLHFYREEQEQINTLYGKIR